MWISNATPEEAGLLRSPRRPGRFQAAVMKELENRLMSGIKAMDPRL